ncbi:Cys-rich peptide radical SAM maturase CcpM [Clostridium botulinum]|uniref:Cys-rich peptide radical SAM maturase CcpM n=1 Tax=Clostridium sp. LCP25S3_F10 TaxID=3438750 RepID=UPI002A67C43A|nr:Cys-rich peptide radical SAM maturase CcpM [Clostridium botulinum]
MKNDYFIHLFETPLEKYFYDVNMNEIVNIPQTVYKYLNNENMSDEDISTVEKYVENLKDNGYLKKKRVETVKHPLTKCAKCYIDNKINYMVLQVTQNCNLRCEYCVYSGGYDNRVHNKSRMDIGIAKKGIDFLVKHSSDCEELKLGFYGGEPLLEFELIKQCVKYAAVAVEGKKIKYYITTNGTLISDEVIDFFYNNNFTVTISLDGPSHIHNRSRHFAHSDKGSFDKIMENLSNIKKKYPEYYQGNIQFNTVLTTENGFSEIEEFFKNNSLLKNNTMTSSLVSDVYAKGERKVGEDYVSEERYLEFLMLLSKIGWLKDYRISQVMKGIFDNVLHFEEEMSKQKREELPDEWHHGGPCMPGVKRLFMTVDGQFYPCEKLSETREENKIGDVFDGINIEQVHRILNIESMNHNICRNCWAYSFCGNCILHIDNVDKENNSHNNTMCSVVRRETEEKMKTWCILKKLNYDFENEKIQV